MNIGIVTVYDSINSGSFWQAKCLGALLSNMGHTVFYLKRNKDKRGSSSSKQTQFKKYVSLLLKGDFKRAALYRSRLREFKAVRRDLPIIRYDDAMQRLDLFVLGSDTIWNLSSAYFRNNWKTYWGAAFVPKPTIAYAASVANAEIDRFPEYEPIREQIRNLRSISVRDRHTYAQISRLQPANLEIVCDPVLLFDKAYYTEIAERCPETRPFVFLYLFKPLSTDAHKRLADWAHQHDLRVIQGAGETLYPACDDVIVNAPKRFLSYMLNASYVVTDTFHGTLFSTVLEKNFVSIDRGKNKVEDYLGRIDCAERLVTDDLILRRFEEPIDYAHVSEQTAAFRDASRRFLLEAVDGSETEH